MSAWRALGVSVRGAAHVEEGVPCQDAVSWAASGPWLVAAACDGAGSAAHAEVGATAGAEAFVRSLLRLAPSVAVRDPEAVTAAAREAVRDARAAVRDALPPGATLAHAHATLIGAVASPRGGALVHVGDGVGAAWTASGAVVSGPENGAFANETFFFTEDGWRDHLRVTLFDPPHRLFLFTDGAASVAVGPGGVPAPTFVEPVAAYLRSVPEADGRGALAQTLAPERTGHLTDDDLTVFWAEPSAIG